MNKECEELLEKIQSIAKNAPSNLHDELYPKKLGQAVMMQSPEQRFVVISKYEGIGLVLKDLGADIKLLEIMIEEEGDKTLKGRY
jgi:hypothetical protein